ncbi:hypothetical protein HPB50_028675 [Hyalomma asiaticum]|nr:hypothetical protein HPB50_028675 [Hyalomma asiaticum]
MGGSKFLVCTRKANQATKLMVAEGFRLNREKVAVEAVGPPVTYVNVYRLPAYLPDDVLTNALQQQNKLNGVKVVKMEMSKPVPNFTTIQGHRVKCEYRGMRRVCARYGDDGHMASACTRPYCKRCGVFGHDTEGCVEECKRSGGHHDLTLRQHVASRPRATHPPTATRAAKRPYLRRPEAKIPAPDKKKTPNYWDGDKTEENDARSAATSSLTHLGDQRDGSEDTASVTSDSDHLAICTSESTSAEPSPNSSPSPTSSGEEQAVPTFAASLEAATTQSPHANSESLAQPPLGSSRVASLEDAPIVSCGRYVLPPEHAYVIPASDPGPSRQALVDSRTEAAPPTAGASQPGLSQRHRSRTRFLRPSKTSASRIDGTYLPYYLLASVVECEVVDLPGNLSGKSAHLPLAATVRGSPGFSSRYLGWRLDPSLLHDEVCVQRVRDRIRESLDNVPSLTPHVWDTLKEGCKKLLQEEGRDRKRRLSAQMGEILRRTRIVKEAESLTPCTREYLETLQATYTHLLQLKTGRPAKKPYPPDSSTDPGSRDVYGNGGVKITEAKRLDGSITSDPGEIADIFRKYFSTQFHESDSAEENPNRMHISELCRDLRRPGEEELTDLRCESSMEELRCAIRNMLSNSAPGSDGLTAGFYATFLDTLGETLLSLVNVILRQHKKPDSFSVGRIVLLLKDGAPPNEPASWRPITLLNVDYKIVASIINSRLKALLPNIISPFQSCAVPGRSIFANLTATRDIFEYAARKKLYGAFFSLDQAKAFDRVKHNYLLGVLREFGFPADFVALVRLLYSDLTGNVVANGSITAGFDYTRGIRQGCALGPTFFINSLEPLLAKLANNERIRGLREFWNTFNRYAEVSGATINEGKSKALLFGSFPRESLGEIQTVSMVKVLGIYFTCDGVAEATWQRALEKAHLVATRIQHLDLTLREKALAVKTSVCAFANYVCRVAVMPSKTASQLNRIINTLLWDGKPAPVKRNLLQLPESEGGLGLPHVMTTGRILALKTVRLLYQASGFFGKGLLLYWSSTNTKCLDADRHTGPLAEFPSPFYKMTANTKRMLDKHASFCDIDRDPPARIAETLRSQLSPEECGKTASWKRSKAKLSRGLPRELYVTMSTFACRVIMNGKEVSVYEAVDVNGMKVLDNGQQVYVTEEHACSPPPALPSPNPPPVASTSTALPPQTPQGPQAKRHRQDRSLLQMEGYLSYLKVAEEAREKWRKDCLELEERRLAAEERQHQELMSMLRQLSTRGRSPRVGTDFDYECD